MFLNLLVHTAYNVHLTNSCTVVLLYFSCHFFVHMCKNFNFPFVIIKTQNMLFEDLIIILVYCCAFFYHKQDTVQLFQVEYNEKNIFQVKLTSAPSQLLKPHE